MNNTIIDQSVLLNEFELKTLFNGLKKRYSIINIVPRISSLEQVYYIAFFEREGIIFSKHLYYRKTINPVDPKPSFSDYLATCVRLLNEFIEEIDSTILLDTKSEKASFSFLSHLIHSHIVEQHDRFFKLELINRNMNYKRQLELKQKSLKLFEEGNSARSIYSKLFRYYKFSNKKFVNKILDSKGVLTFNGR